MPKEFKTKILRRFMTEEELEELARKYQDKRSILPFLFPLTAEEKETLDLYLKRELSLKGVAKRLDIPISSSGNKVRTLALRLLAEEYQSLKRK